MKDVLVLRLSALGDVIHTIPAVAGLRNAHPDARIRWVVEAPYRELVEVVAGVEAVPVRLKKRELSLRAMRGADTAIDFQGLIKSAVLARLSGAKRRIGFDKNAIREKPALLFTNEKVRVDTTKHVIDQNLQLAGVPWTAANWSAYPQPVEGFGGDVVLLPGAGKPNKLWPVARFRELARRIGPKALVVWGPGERDLAEAIGARMAPPTNLRQLAWLLQNAQVVIGADTGPLHLADALGTKLIGLYGPTDPRRNGPYTQQDRVIDRYRATKLMESISVEEVMTLLQKVSGQ
jgi:heptosyltransferase-1